MGCEGRAAAVTKDEARDALTYGLLNAEELTGDHGAGFVDRTADCIDGRFSVLMDAMLIALEQRGLVS